MKKVYVGMSADLVHPGHLNIINEAKKILPDLNYCTDEYETARDSDALVILTEWNQVRNLDLLKIKKLLKTPILLDLRNLCEPAQVKELGFIYEGMGRV